MSGRHGAETASTDPPEPKVPDPKGELISAVSVVDVRFPASRERDGSDATNPSPATRPSM